MEKEKSLFGVDPSRDFFCACMIPEITLVSTVVLGILRSLRGRVVECRGRFGGSRVPEHRADGLLVATSGGG